MTTLVLIGIGPGHPRYLTRQATEAMQGCDTILIPRKGAGKDDLADLRRAICADIAPDVPLRDFTMPRRDAGAAYLDGVNDWHDAIAGIWSQQIAASGAARVGLLVWGDPSLYDSTLRIAERLSLPVEVIPGITAIQTLTAGHAIALNTLGAPVVITTGRQIRDHGWPVGTDTVVVMLDSGGAFGTLPPEGLHIWWSAFGGMDQEIRISGPLSEVADQIASVRARAREDHGWIMDIYLIRKV